MPRYSLQTDQSLLALPVAATFPSHSSALRTSLFHPCAGDPVVDKPSRSFPELGKRGVSEVHLVSPILQARCHPQGGRDLLRPPSGGFRSGQCATGVFRSFPGR